MPERVGVIRPSASFPNVCFTRSATMLRPVVGVMGLIFLPVPLSWRAKRGRGVVGRLRGQGWVMQYKHSPYLRNIDLCILAHHQ